MVPRARFLASFAALLATTAVATRADAVGATFADPLATSVTLSARAAVALGGSRTTTWLQTRITGGADTVVWLVSVPADATVDYASTAFLDALEEATAPRIRPPVPQAGETCATQSEPFVVTDGDAPAPAPTKTTASLHGSDAPEALAGLLDAWGISPTSVDLVPLAQELAAGRRIVALRLAPEPGESATKTLRVTGSGAAIPLSLTRSEAGAPVPFTLWVMGPSRAMIGGAVPVTLDNAAITWTGNASTSYPSARSALLAGDARKLLLESSTATGSTNTTLVLPEGVIPSLVDAYLVRAVQRQSIAGDIGKISAQVHAKLADRPALATPCPRGDLVTGAPCDAGLGPLAGVLPAADDLLFALAGPAGPRWISRFAGEIPAGGHGAPFVPMAMSGPELPVARSASAPPSVCTAAAPSGGSGQTGGGTPGRGGNPGTGTDPGDGSESDGSSTSVDVVVSDGSSCDGSSGGGSCDSDSSSDGGCSSDSSGGDESSGCSNDSGGDGCSNDSSGDGCSGGESGGDGCSGGEGSSGGGCSGGEGSSGGGCGGGGGGDCSTTPRRRSRPTPWAFLFAAVALPLRRRFRTRRTT